MTIYRFPVPDHPTRIPPYLACIDFGKDIRNPRQGSRCKELYEAHAEKNSKSTSNVDFKCPNLRNKVPGYCWRSSFLYPRKWSAHYKQIHFHQGVDMAGGKLGARVVSVTGGVVTFATDEEYKRGCGGYGRMVVVYDDTTRDGYYYCYAHLKKGIEVSEGDHVQPGQVIGYVGNSGTRGGSIVDYSATGAHLHFEVSASRYPKAGGKETELGAWDASSQGLPRLDPLKVLEELGPYGATEVFDLAKVRMEYGRAQDLHGAVEASSRGFFPIGTNNFWHGGVHLPMPNGTTIHAPFDGTIVAARLGSDPATVNHAYGSTNFILLRHEIPQAVFAAMQQAYGPQPATGPGGSSGPANNDGKIIGLGKHNPSPEVEQLKERLFDLGHYDGPLDEDDETNDTEDSAVVVDFADPTIGDADDRAIRSFQSTLDSPFRRESTPWPDGEVSIGGYTWTALFKDAPPAEPTPGSPASPAPTKTDAKRTIYSLFMHLEPLHADDALAKEIAWLPLEVDDDGAEAASHTMSGRVGQGNGNTADIEWVEKRLIRFGYLTRPSDQPTATEDAALSEAITQFQKNHPFKEKNFGDGWVGPPPGKTATFLAKTKTELFDGVTPERRADREMVAKLEALGADGAPQVLSGVNIKVAAKSPLWTSGTAIGFDEEHGQQEREEIHWEMFSEHLIFGDWNDAIDDDDDDLTADIRQDLLAEIEDADLSEDRNGRIEPAELKAFYSSGRGEVLRRTPCRFRTEWGMDVDKVVARVRTLGFAAPSGLIEGRVAAYQWWDAAADVLPGSETGQPVRRVWHYNPIEFLADYQETLDSLQPADPPPPRPLTEYGNLDIRVVGPQGLPPKRASKKADRVKVSVYEGHVEPEPDTPAMETADVDKDGTKRFFELDVGSYTVLVDATSLVLPVHEFVELVPASEAQFTAVQIEAAVIEADSGNLTLKLVHAEGGAARNATVTITGPEFPDGIEKTAWGGNVVLRKLAPGTYTVHADHPGNGKGHPNDQVELDTEITFDGISVKKTLTFSPRMCDLTILYNDRGLSVAGTITHKDGYHADFITTGEGKAIVRVPRKQRPYDVQIEGQTKRVQAALKERRYSFR